MENIIGEEVQHPEYGHGVIKFQQTRIGVEFDNHEQVHNFDYPEAFRSCLVAESNRLRDILDKIPNWRQCRYCGLYYELVPSDTIFATYNDADYCACEKCRKKMYKCGCCHEWFYNPALIKHDVEDGIPVCNRCYRHVFMKPTLQLPIPFEQLLEWSFTIDDLYEYISVFDEMRSIGIGEALLSKHRPDKIEGHKTALTKSESHILFLITQKLQKIVKEKMNVEAELNVIRKIIRKLFKCSLETYSDDFRYMSQHPLAKLITQYSSQMNLYCSIEMIRKRFETELYYYSIAEKQANALTTEFFNHETTKYNIDPYFTRCIVHILQVSEVKQIMREYDNKYLNAEFTIDSIPLPNTQDELYKRAEMIWEQLVSYEDNKFIATNLTEALDYYKITHPTELDFRPSNDILYLYKGNCIRCKRYSNHQIISATAMIKTEQKERVPINVEYCTECEKFIMAYSSYERYRKRYKFLIIKLQEVDENGGFPKGFYASLKQNDKSPLKLAGYNVDAAIGLSSEERHQILLLILNEGVLPKYRVCEYLRYFISQGEPQDNKQNAVAKWREDLEFVENYMIEEQPEQDINYYSKY